MDDMVIGWEPIRNHLKLNLFNYDEVTSSLKKCIIKGCNSKDHQMVFKSSPKYRLNETHISIPHLPFINKVTDSTANVLHKHIQIFCQNISSPEHALNHLSSKVIQQNTVSEDQRCIRKGSFSQLYNIIKNHHETNHQFLSDNASYTVSSSHYYSRNILEAVGIAN